MIGLAGSLLEKAGQMKDMELSDVDLGEGIETISVDRMDLSNGKVSVTICLREDCYYEAISQYTGLPVSGEYELFGTLSKLSAMKEEYGKAAAALNQVRAKGYGIVMPDQSEILLDEPQLIRHGNKFGVKIHAQAPSINLIKAHIETEIAPIVGSEQQARI